MSTITSPVFVFMTLEWPITQDGERDYCAEKVWRPEFGSCRVEDTDARVFIGVQQFACVIPDDFDPTAKQVAALEAAKQKAMDQYQRTVADINARLSKLLAITNEAEA